MQKSNLNLGDEKTKNISQYTEDYINHPTKYLHPEGLQYLIEQKRRSHFDIGEDKPFEGESVTQKDYKNPYNNPNYNPNTSQIVRKSNLSLGQEKGDFISTYQKNMTPKRGIKNYKIANPKSDLILGQEDPDYKTKYNIEYYDKSSIPQPNDLYEIKNKMRKDQTILGSDKPELITEHAAEYTKKEIDKNKQPQVNIQRGHQVVIGDQNIDWDTTYRQKYTPKKNDNDPNLKLNMQKSNLNLGDDNTKKITQYTNDYIQHPIRNLNPNLKDFLAERKKSHFDIGENKPFEGESVTQKDYKNPYNNINYFSQGINQNSKIIRRGSFNIGDKNLEGEYETTYQRNMTPKRTVKDYFHKRKQKDFILGENEPDYKTKYNIEYYDKSSIPHPNDLYEIQKRMRKDQTILGSDKPDLITEHAAEYTKKEIIRDKSNPQINTNKEHNDLIGYQNIDWNTTYRQKYTPKKNENDPNLKLNMQKSNILLGDGKFQNKTKYTEDYINYPIKNTPQNLHYITERRKNNFDIGQNNIFEGESVTKKDYSNPYNNPNYIPNQSQIIKKSNFSIGDKNLEGIYETTYQTQMTPKRTIGHYNMIKKIKKILLIVI